MCPAFHWRSTTADGIELVQRCDGLLRYENTEGPDVCDIVRRERLGTGDRATKVHHGRPPRSTSFGLF